MKAWAYISSHREKLSLVIYRCLLSQSLPLLFFVSWGLVLLV